MRNAHELRTIAVDWSGRLAGAERTIWLAEARAGRLIRLEHGRSREAIADWLIAEAANAAPLVAGLDFAFALPAWYMRERGYAAASELWSAMAAGGCESLLARCEPPFWGRPGKSRPFGQEQFRLTDRLHRIGGIAPKSAFQLGGAGAVGTGSLRGMPVLHRLHAEGFRVWPFCAAGTPVLIEIYPRRLTGPVRKSSLEARMRFLRPLRERLGPLAHVAATSEDAFDAAISASMMSLHVGELANLRDVATPEARLEGMIWAPQEDACELS